MGAHDDTGAPDLGARLAHEVEAELHANQERLALATEVNGIGIWELNLTDGQVTWSDMMFRIFGLPPEQFTGRIEDWVRCIHPEDLEYTHRELMAAIRGHKSMDFDFRVVHPDGRVRYVYARATVFRDTQGQPQRVLGANYDVTERKLMERELAEKHELLRVTLHSIGDAVITTDAHGRVQWLNPVAERMTGWPTEAARDMPLTQVFQIVNEHTREPEQSPVDRCLAEDIHVGAVDHTLLISRDGTEYGIEDSAAPIRDEEGQVLGVVLIFHDVTEQRRMGHEMSFRATHDELTGLVNRAEFDQRLQRVLTAAQQDAGITHALMYIDLDQFKLVNDACGHSVGDQLLCKVTAMLQGCVRSRDTVARLGGDEFGAILEHCTVDQAHRVAQDICDQMEDFRFVHEGRRFRIGTSIGLVPVDSRWSGTQALMQAADSACYAAKEAGRNRVHAWYDTDQAIRSRRGEMQWASRLEQALDEDLFVLHAQRILPLKPQARPGSSPARPGIGAAQPGLHIEVLLRLPDPGGGGDDGERDGQGHDAPRLIPPSAFLPAAERFHMSTRIDRWVVRKVLEWLSWQDAERLAAIDTVGINVSAHSLSDPAFQRFVLDQVASTSVDARKLCLEVAEAAAITNLADAASFMAAVRERGVRIALDDFGTGASSFGYLKTLPVDYLKIDGQFIRELAHSPLDQATLRCFCEVAGILGIQTVAESVESAGVLDKLHQMGVDFAQGFVLHAPQPLDALLMPAGHDVPDTA